MTSAFNLKKTLTAFVLLLLAGIHCAGAETLYYCMLSDSPRFLQRQILQVNNRKIKIALLLDTSNSMDGLIEQAKSQLWAIVNELAAAKCDDSVRPEIEIALYEYGNDRLPMSEGYIRLVTPLTSDLDKVSADLFSLTTMGGAEFCGKVIQTAARQLNWSAESGDLQVMFIAGNEEFTQGNVNFREACAEAARKNIIVNTIFCGSFQEGVNTSWKTGADLTGGSYMSIEQDRKTVYIASPYDDRITQLNRQLNSTYVEYGSEGKKKKEQQEIQDKNAEKYGKQNTVNRTISKSSHVYKNKTWDLVDAADEKDFKLSEVPQEQLPDTMKTMTLEQKQKYVAEKKLEREKIKQEIGELTRKREQYVAQEKQKTQSSEKTLDNSIIQSIRKQAVSKNFKF